MKDKDTISENYLMARSAERLKEQESIIKTTQLSKQSKVCENKNKSTHAVDEQVEKF